MTQLRSQSKLKLYADEDIEEEAIQYLRDNNVNITSARELGRRGLPDSDQMAYAYKEGRCLFTRNGKDFDGFSFKSMAGLIVISGQCNEDDFYDALDTIIIHLVPQGYYCPHMKIWVSAEGMTVKGLDNGQPSTRHFRKKNGEWYEVL